MNLIEHLSEKLTHLYPWRRWHFGLSQEGKIPVGANLRNHSFQKPMRWAWRHIVKTVLTGGSSEEAAFRAIEPLFRDFQDAYELGHADQTQVAATLQKARIKFADRKADFVVGLSRQVAKRRGEVPSSRAGLESLPGVGKHIASIMMATIFGEEEFGIDLHVRRITKRMGIVKPSGGDYKIEREIRRHTRSEKLGHFSRSFVDFGQDVCGFHARCHVCPFADKCAFYNEAPRKEFYSQLRRVLALRPGSNEWLKYGKWRVYFDSEWLSLDERRLSPGLSRDAGLKTEASRLFDLYREASKSRQKPMVQLTLL